MATNDGSREQIYELFVILSRPMFKVAHIPYQTKPNIYCNNYIRNSIGEPRGAGPITMGRP